MIGDLLHITCGWMYYKDWVLFRYNVWLEGGSAWVQAKYIVEDMEAFAQEKGLHGEIKPVVGSNDPSFDEALAQAIMTFGYQTLVAEITERQKNLPDEDNPDIDTGD